MALSDTYAAGHNDGLTGWSAAVVVASFAVGAVAWAGVTQVDHTTPSVAAPEAPAVANQDVSGAAEVALPPAEDPNVVAQASVLVPMNAVWAPGTLIQSTDHYPQPGETFSTQACTAAFSFTGADGRAYAVTAGHCGDVGDLVWPTNAEYAWDYATPAGKFIYSGMQDQVDGVGVDIGIIEITDPQRTMEVVGVAIPTGIIPEAQRAAAPVCKTGGTTGYTCGVFDHADRVQIVTDDTGQEMRTRGDIARVCAAKGDSGGPVFTEVNGRSAVIGVVSGTEAGVSGGDCADESEQSMLMSYSTAQQALEAINKVVPDAQFIQQGW